VRVLAHPLRLRLLEAFALGPCTTKQAAERLGEPPTRLYHHVYAMERAGILRLRETRPNRGTIEKYFEPVAHRFEADPSLFARTRATGAAHPAVAIAHAAIDELRSELGPGLAAADRLPEGLKPILMRMVIHGDAARIRALREEVAALIRRRQGCAPESKPVRGRGAASPKGRVKRTAGARLRYTLTIALLSSAAPTGGRAGAARAGARSAAGAKTGPGASRR
jgi:hypothetical protein